MNPTEKSESLKKALNKKKAFDEADYYRSAKSEIGGDDVLEDSEENEDPEDDDGEEEEFYGDED